jgi:hypothetical protein
MNRLPILALALLSACTTEPDIVCFECGPSGQPGDGLPEGGEIRHEYVRQFGEAPATWLQIYQYKGPAAVTNAALPAPVPNAPFGTCVDERDPLTASWPFKPISGASYLDLPTVNLTAPVLGMFPVARATPPDQIGKSTFRSYDLTYGGSLDAIYSTLDAEYTLDIGQGPMRYAMPTDYEAPLGIGGADTVVIAGGADLELDWEGPLQTEEHTRKSAFDYIVFADPTAAFAPQFMCFPEVAGNATIPESVINALAAAGLVFHVRTTHYMEAQDADGETRRFDLVSTITNVSRYAKQ